MKENGVGLTDSEVNQNLRVMNYNSFLSGIGYKKGTQVWWTAIIKLDEPACTNKFTRKKFLLCPTTKCLVLCLDLLLEDSNYLEEDEAFEEVVVNGNKDCLCIWILGLVIYSYRKH